MQSLLRELHERERDIGPIRVGLVGCGQMGMSLLMALTCVKGMDVVAVSTTRRDEVRSTMEAEGGIPCDRIAHADDPARASELIDDGRYVLVSDPVILARTPNLDVVVDATGRPEIGAEVAWEALCLKKHVVTFNVEADVTVGMLLKAKADEMGVVYSGITGDEPGALMELYRFAEFLGLPVSVLGKGKNHKFVPSATPDWVHAEAKKQGVSPRSYCAFVDGTNTMIEMACVANATGFRPDVTGMHGPSCDVKEIGNVFVPRDLGGILHSEGVVEYAMGGVAPGVFAVVRAKHRVVRDVLAYVSMGSGPYHVLYRPYHLTSIEAPVSIAKAVLQNEGTIAPRRRFTAQVMAVTKRPLRRGQRLDGIGGGVVRGVIERSDIFEARDLLPIGLASDAVLTRDVEEGECLQWNDVAFSSRSILLDLYFAQRQAMDEKQERR